MIGDTPIATAGRAMSAKNAISTIAVPAISSGAGPPMTPRA